jgi:Tfp pilus assembly protein PilP
MSLRVAYRLLPIICVAIIAVGSAHGEEPIPTPSEKMKDAVGKFNKAPASIGQSLQGLRDAAAAKLKETFRSSAKAEGKAAQPDDLNMPQKTSEIPAAPRVLKEGSRDPFRSPQMPKRAITRVRENLSPLQQRDLSQFNLVGIVRGNKEPVAVMVDTAGVTYIVNVGTPIGLNDGTVKSISPDEVIMEEYCEDVYGARKKCVRSKRLKTE